MNMKPIVLIGLLSLSLASTAFGQSGCNIKALEARKDVKRAMLDAAANTNHDGREHAFAVTTDGIVQSPEGTGGQVNVIVPTGTIALFHTHPSSGLNQPSATDIVNLIALQTKRPGVCSYVLGHTHAEMQTVFEIFPDGSTKMVSFF